MLAFLVYARNQETTEGGEGVINAGTLRVIYDVTFKVMQIFIGKISFYFPTYLLAFSR